VSGQHRYSDGAALPAPELIRCYEADIRAAEAADGPTTLPWLSGKLAEPGGPTTPTGHHRHAAVTPGDSALFPRITGNLDEREG
jgi:hypothetical protein